ncbi:MAG: hypothetical protein ACTSRZ_15800 [Promethearchaeota archaeon]
MEKRGKSKNNRFVLMEKKSKINDILNVNEWLLSQKITIQTKLTNEELMCAKIFLKNFGFYPSSIVKYNNVLIFLINSKKHTFFFKNLKQKKKILKNHFPSTFIYIKNTSQTLKELIFSLFSHINWKNIISIECEFSKNNNHNGFWLEKYKEYKINQLRINNNEKHNCNDEIDFSNKNLNYWLSEIPNNHKKNLNIFLNIYDKAMPLALGRNGSYIHCVNYLLKCIKFKDNYINSFIKKMQLFLHSENKFF